MTDVNVTEPPTDRIPVVPVITEPLTDRTPAVAVPRSAPDLPATPERPFRPAPPSIGYGRRLRSVIGIDEEILDMVPEERARYSRMGVIVLATGTMAMLSASVFLARVGAPFILVLPIAVFWGGLIVAFDSWLVASTHGMLGAGRLRIFVPRLLISILMGAVIAEPLLLFLFAPSIQTEARDERMSVISQYETRLRDCNPLTGAAPTVDGCGTEFVLNVPGSPGPLLQERTDTQARRDALSASIDTRAAELERREELARTECNGTPTDQTTGRVGVGVNCRRNRAEADDYRTSSGLAADQAILTGLDRTIDDLNTRISAVNSTYAANVTERIAQQVEARRADQTSLGILDEHSALERLTERSAFVFVLSWLVRILLIVIDCLPVLTKLLSRPTAYDKMLHRQLDADDRTHERLTAEREQNDVGVLDIAIARNAQHVRTEIAQVDLTEREHHTGHERSLDEQIEQLAADIRRGAQRS